MPDPVCVRHERVERGRDVVRVPAEIQKACA